MLHTVLIWLAVLLLFAAIFNPTVKFNVLAAGLFCWAASQLVV